MAEAVIGSLVLKIGDALADEAAKSVVSLLLTWISAMKELKKDISEIKAELRGMQSFLQIAKRLKERDESINTYIEEIRELAFDIEDIIDEFTYKLGEEQGGVLPTTIKRCKNIITWRDLSKRVKEIKTKLQNIIMRRARYNAGSIEIKPSPLIAKGGSNCPAEDAHFFKEDDLEGIEKNRDLLLQWLKDEGQQNMIISVLGMGGLGKTTLVTHVYNIIKNTFDASAWVSVSQSYNSRDDLLRKIIKEFFSEDRKRKKTVDNTDNIGDIDNMDFINLVKTICNLLQNKRYIIILDDVWSRNVWSDIKYAFLEGNSNGKIVLTTQKNEVARLAHKHSILELKSLEAKHSWNLFCKNAFRNNTDRICPPQLKHWAEKIVEKCRDLPLAIVSIGSLLSYKDQLETEWENVYKDLDWHLTSNSSLDERVKNILELSLEDLPYYLRNCFLYCCIFSDDYKIKRKRIIRLWVAEGFIEERESRTMEEVAEDYLNELVHRCLLQVVARNEFERVRECRMHDIVRVLALSKSKDEKFYMDYKHLSTSQSCKARRTSVTSGEIEHWKEDKSYLRSLLLFNSSMNCDLLKSVSKSSKFLCVLDLQGSSIKEVPSEIGNLFNLRFLGLRGTEIEMLPKSIGKLQNLQTLDVLVTKIKRLPEEVTNLRKLRHLFVRSSSSSGVPTPKGIWHLKDLQTLQYFEANSEMVRKVGALINLRTFCITKVRTCHCADLCRAIENMNHLVNLTIERKDEQEILHWGALRLPQSIRKLYLDGQLDKNYFFLESFGSLTNLTELRLRWSRLVEDPLPYIQELPKLLVLKLVRAYDGIKLCFKTASFPTLKELEIWDAPELNQIEIEKKAMPCVQKLWLSRCPELKVLPQGIEHLTTLQELYFTEPAKELLARLRGGGEGGDESCDDRMKIERIPNVMHSFQRGDGEWVHEKLQAHVGGSTMAEAVVTSLVLKIGAILADEATKSVSAVKELMNDMSEIMPELRGMQSFLQNVERRKERNDSINIFIKEIKELAFDIEDIIDEFTYKLGEEQGGVLPTALMKRSKNMKTWHHLSKRAKDIKIKLQSTMERRNRYDTKGMENEAKPLIVVGSSKSGAESAHFVDDDDIGGIDKQIDLLLGWLKDEDEQQQQPMIISVFGMGGLGKTTLVTHVYNKIKATFDAWAWVVVSQSHETNDLLRQILKEFCKEDREKREVPNNFDTMGYRSLVETIRTYLQGKKYVLILDDVWSTDVMDKIKYALLNGNSKSRIILTTRMHEVAQLANEHRMFELKTLEANISWHLFCKNAFWKSANKICPRPLEHCANKIVKKCGGLPLAIVSIGRLLSFREQTDSEWEKVYKDLEWYLANKVHGKLGNILKLSLDDLPHYLRNCFLYCSSFPEDYEIESERLIRLWVAEGFIEERSERTMEDVAEDYLKELVHRCLLQVAGRDVIGRVYSYRMHDIIRVLALSQSKEESFCMVYEHSRTMLQLDKARRLSILRSTSNYCTEGKSQLRSILVFNNSMSSDLLNSALRSSKLLRVLELRGASIEELPSEICNLFNLHYLGLGETKIKELPRSIGKLQNLQILDIGYTGIKKLPKGIIKLQKLRHLLLSEQHRSIEVPVEIRRLKSLQSLEYIKATTEIVRNLEALTELRTFWIDNVRTHHCADLWNSITKMNHLSHLKVKSEDGHQELQQLDTLRLPLPIQNLVLEGKLDKNSLPELATSFGSLTNLTTLELHSSKLDEDTFPYLQALPALMVLGLSKEAYDGTKLHFQATSFPKLKKLFISKAMKLSQVEIERGAMPSLNVLQLSICPELRELPHGIEYLTTLHDLFILLPAEELGERLLEEGEGDHNNDWRSRVRHIPNFTINEKRIQ